MLVRVRHSMCILIVDILNLKETINKLFNKKFTKSLKKIKFTINNWTKSVNMPNHGINYCSYLVVT